MGSVLGSERFCGAAFFEDVVSTFADASGGSGEVWCYGLKGVSVGDEVGNEEGIFGVHVLIPVANYCAEDEAFEVCYGVVGGGRGGLEEEIHWLLEGFGGDATGLFDDWHTYC